MRSSGDVLLVVRSMGQPVGRGSGKWLRETK